MLDPPPTLTPGTAAAAPRTPVTTGLAPGPGSMLGRVVRADQGPAIDEEAKEHDRHRRVAGGGDPMDPRREPGTGSRRLWNHDSHTRVRDDPGAVGMAGSLTLGAPSSTARDVRARR